jgi:hypothetical protein
MKLLKGRSQKEAVKPLGVKKPQISALNAPWQDVFERSPLFTSNLLA